MSAGTTSDTQVDISSGHVDEGKAARISWCNKFIGWLKRLSDSPPPSLSSFTRDEIIHMVCYSALAIALLALSALGSYLTPTASIAHNMLHMIEEAVCIVWAFLFSFHGIFLTVIVVYINFWSGLYQGKKLFWPPTPKIQVINQTMTIQNIS